MNIKNGLTIIVREKTKHNGDYKYLITSGAYSYTAYHTQKGFDFFLKSRNLKLQLVEERQTEELGKVQVFKTDNVIVEKSFWRMEEVPKNAIRFTGLSNGSLVDCYYLHTSNGSEVYRPNPNAKEVYKPMPIDEHIAFQRIYG